MIQSHTDGTSFTQRIISQNADMTVREEFARRRGQV